MYSYEVLAVRWGFPTRDGQRLQLWEKRTPHRPHFPKAQLGPRYQAARVIVSKAFRRLEQRGLAQRGRSHGYDGQTHLGLTLTPTGIHVAQSALQHYGPQWEEAYWQAMDPASRVRGSHTINHT